MKFQKKNLWMTALAGMLTIAFVGGCPDEEDGTTTTTTTTPADKTAKVWTWTNTKVAGKEDVSMLSVSTDGSHAYAVTDTKKGLSVVELATFGNASTDTNWKAAALEAKGLDNSAGKSNTLVADAGNTISRLEPSKKGMFVSVSANTAAQTGAYYFEGTSMKAGWASENTHIDNHVIANTENVTGLVVTKKDGTEYPAVVSTGAVHAHVGLSTATLAVPAVFADTHFLTAHTTAGNFDFQKPVFVAGSVDDRIYLANHVGIHRIQETKFGAAAAAATEFAVHNQDKFDHADWKIGGNDQSGDHLTGAIVVGNKMYVSFKNNADVGGVVVADIKAKTVVDQSVKAIAADAAWAKANVLGLVKDSSNVVWAVMPDGLHMVGSDGKKGAKFGNGMVAVPAYADVDESITYVEGAAPSANITAAAFVGDNLLVATGNKGVFVMEAGTKKVSK